MADSIITRKKSASSGAVIALVQRGEAFLAQCLTHGKEVMYEFRKDAVVAATRPGVWCSECATAIAAKKKKLQDQEDRILAAMDKIKK